MSKSKFYNGVNPQALQKALKYGMKHGRVYLERDNQYVFVSDGCFVYRCDYRDYDKLILPAVLHRAPVNDENFVYYKGEWSDSKCSVMKAVAGYNPDTMITRSPIIMELDDKLSVRVFLLQKNAADPTQHIFINTRYSDIFDHENGYWLGSNPNSIIEFRCEVDCYAWILPVRLMTGSSTEFAKHLC